MAGMLPGVEAARRRRFHQSNNLNNGGASTRRSSFCLYVSNYQDSPIKISISSMERNPMTMRQTGSDDEKLEAAARDAKKRLDHKLRNLCKSEIKRNPKGARKIYVCGGDAKGTAQGHLKQVYRSMRKSGYQSS